MDVPALNERMENSGALICQNEVVMNTPIKTESTMTMSVMSWL